MDEEIFVAELANPNRDKAILNSVAAATFAVAIVFLLMAIMFGDVIDKSMTSSTNNSSVRVPVWERGNLDYITDKDHGFVMEFGDYEIL